MAIKNSDPSTNSLSSIRVSANSQVNQELNAFDFTNPLFKQRALYY